MAGWLEVMGPWWGLGGISYGWIFMWFSSGNHSSSLPAFLPPSIIQCRPFTIKFNPNCGVQTGERLFSVVRARFGTLSVITKLIGHLKKKIQSTVLRHSCSHITKNFAKLGMLVEPLWDPSCYSVPCCPRLMFHCVDFMQKLIVVIFL